MRKFWIKFHKYLKPPSILIEFQTNSVALLLFWILIQICIKILESFNNQFFTHFKYYIPVFYFKFLELRKVAFRTNQI
jgi:hypothetical protein